MKILMFTWKSFGDEDIIRAFRQLNHEVVTAPLDFGDIDLHQNEAAQARLESVIRREGPGAVFTFNYFPILASACKETDVPYLSWVYDSPVVLLYSYTVIFPTNHIFVFASDTYLEFHNQGIGTVHFLPMAADPDRLLEMAKDTTTFDASVWKNQCDVAFIGSLYTEKHTFYDRLTHISPYTRGYLEGLMAAQKQVYGLNFVEQNLTEEIMEDMKQDLPMEPDPAGVERKSWLYTHYVINRKLTSLERMEYLSAIGAEFGLDLYTPDKTLALPGCVNHGPVDYYDMAPFVFQRAKINLNISLRSIVNGIPLRCFDIMGNGGFLLTNYQGDFLEYFVPGEDFAYYESKEDLMNKIRYYLAPENQEERRAIAENGLLKIREAHTFVHRAKEMLDQL